MVSRRPINAVASRTTLAPEGLGGGAAGRFLVTGKNVSEARKIVMKPNDEVTLETPGGGGYGKPRVGGGTTEFLDWKTTLLTAADYNRRARYERPGSMPEQTKRRMRTASSLSSRVHFRRCIIYLRSCFHTKHGVLGTGCRPAQQGRFQNNRSVLYELRR